MAKRILLVKTSIPTENLHVNVPVGLLYLASAARAWVRIPLECKVVDMRIGSLGLADMEVIFRNFDPHVVGMSAFTYEEPMMHALARRFKSVNPQVSIIAGGPHATIMPEEVLRNPDIDFAVSGEGEKTFAAILNALFDGNDASGIPGSFSRRNDRIVRNPPAPPIEDLDAIPFPAWDLVNPRDYTSRRVRNMNWIVLRRDCMPIFTSRGCPYHCIYCHHIFGKKFRTRSPENVLEEISRLYRDHGIREIHIIDDVFNFDRERTLSILRKIQDSGMKFKLAFPNGLRGDQMDSEMIESFKQAGTYMMIFAIESASPRMQRFLKKNLNLEKTRKTIELVDKAGLFVKGFFMLGFPTETLDEIKATIDYAAASRLHVASFFQVVPFPGTEMFSLARKDFPEITEVYQKLQYYGASSYYKAVTGTDLSQLQRSAYRKFYRSCWRVWKIILRIPQKKYLFSGLFFFISYASRLRLPWKKKKDSPVPGNLSCDTG